MPKAFVALAFLILFIACEKSPAPEPAKESPQAGNIRGRVKHYDYEGVEKKASRNTTTVSIDQTAHRALTDSLGDFVFNDIPKGLYTLRFEKPGAGLYKKEELWLEGGATVNLNVDLADTAWWVISSASVCDTVLHGIKNMSVSIQMPSIEQQLYAQIFFSKENKIDSRDKNTFQLQSNLIIPHRAVIGSNVFSYEWFNQNGFKPGEKFYAKIYPINPNAGYKDKSGIWICTGGGLAFPTFTLNMP